MSLDTTTTNPSYLFGRLFACFSKISAFTPEEDWVRRQMPKMVMEPYETMTRVHSQLARYSHKRPHAEEEMIHIEALLDTQRQAGVDLNLDAQFMFGYSSQMTEGSTDH